MTHDYRQDLQDAKSKLDELLALREQVETKIARQKRRVAALAELCAADDSSDSNDSPIDLELGGLTEACITVLRGSRKEWLNTSEIQRGLEELGFPIRTYKAPGASIATTINRLAESGEGGVARKLGPGAIEYKWVGMRSRNALNDRVRGLGARKILSVPGGLAAQIEAERKGKK